MDLWRNKMPERPKVLCVRNLLIALLMHVVFFLALFVIATFQDLFKPKEVVIPIELKIVVNENLDGKENEPPPLANPQPPPPPPPKPKPAEVVKIPDAGEKLEAVVKVREKEKPPKKPPEKVPPKKDPPKKVDPSKKEEKQKTKEQLRKERLERMRNAAKATRKKVDIEVKNVPSGDGRTERRIHNKAEIEKLLMQGVKPDSVNRLASNERQRCVSLIRMALQRRWEELSPSIDREGTVVLSVQITDAGRIVNARIVKGCGGALSDKAVLAVARSVGIVGGLSPDFIASCRNESISINYQVESR